MYESTKGHFIRFRTWLLGIVTFLAAIATFVAAGPELPSAFQFWKTHISAASDKLTSMLSEWRPFSSFTSALPLMLLMAVVPISFVYQKTFGRKSPPALMSSCPDLEVSSNDFITVCDALQYIAKESDWGRRRARRTGLSADEVEMSSAPSDEMRQAAYEGKIRMWGKKVERRTGPNLRLREYIPPQYWRDYEIDYVRSLMDPKVEGGITQHGKLPDDDLAVVLYDSLQIDRGEMHRCWRSCPLEKRI